MIVRTIIAIAAALAAMFPSDLPAQIVQTGAGPLEFIGLEQWDAGRLWDSIYALTPGETAHACATVLKEDFGFADASVAAMGDSAGGIYWIATVVEPQHADRIRYRTTSSRYSPADPATLPIARIFRDDWFTGQLAILTYRHVLAGRLDSANRIIESARKEIAAFSVGSRIDSAGVAMIWQFLRSGTAPHIKTGALDALANDGNQTNRIIATARLINFPDDPAVWHALADALRDSSINVSETARLILSEFIESGAPAIDWAPAAGSLRAILGGTNLFAFDQVAEILAKTAISPELAPALLHGNYQLILAKLKAGHPETRKTARALLAQLRGEDRGDDAREWEMWLKGL